MTMGGGRGGVFLGGQVGRVSAKASGEEFGLKRMYEVGCRLRTHSWRIPIRQEENMLVW